MATGNSETEWFLCMHGDASPYIIVQTSVAVYLKQPGENTAIMVFCKMAVMYIVVCVCTHGYNYDLPVCLIPHAAKDQRS